jgi:hypothetical protein
MNRRFVLGGTLAAALALFVWQFISYAVLPWHERTLRPFTDPNAVVQAIRANAPANGVYFVSQGVTAAVSLTPDLADKTQAMGGMLGRQMVIDLATALLLSALVLRLPIGSATRTGVTLGLAGLAAGILGQFSAANWYNFSPTYATVNAADLGLEWLIAGTVLGALRVRAITRLAPDLAPQDSAAPHVSAGQPA